MNVHEVVAAFAAALEGIDAETPGWPQPKLALPGIYVYPENIQGAVTDFNTFIVWCLSGAQDQDGAWERLGDWLSDDGDQSIVAAVLADQTLGGVVSSLLWQEQRNIGRVTLADGRDVVQAEVVFSVLR